MRKSFYVIVFLILGSRIQIQALNWIMSVNHQHHRYNTRALVLVLLLLFFFIRRRRDSGCRWQPLHLIDACFMHISNVMAYVALVVVVVVVAVCVVAVVCCSSFVVGVCCSYFNWNLYALKYTHTHIIYAYLYVHISFCQNKKELTVCLWQDFVEFAIVAQIRQNG